VASTGAAQGMDVPGMDVIDLLAEEDAEIAALFDRFSSPEAREDHVKRAAVGLELRERLAVQDAAKQELVHAALHGTGARDLAEEIDRRARERRRLLAHLDELTTGVTAREVHPANGPEFDRTVLELKAVVESDLRHERDQVVPRLRRELPPDERMRLAGEVEKVRKRAPTHPKADTPLEHEGNPVTKRVRAVFDHMRDYADAPNHSERK